MHYQRLLHTRAWREIRGCPGRLVRREPDPELDTWVREHAVLLPEGVSLDSVSIWLLPGGGGVLSYGKPDGRFVHTLNTPEGLARKCAQLGVDLDGWNRRLNQCVEVDEMWRVTLVDAGSDRMWALGLLRRVYRDLPLAAAVELLQRLPLELPEVLRAEAVALLEEIEEHGGAATVATV